jgi:hypothetical protein
MRTPADDSGSTAEIYGGAAATPFPTPRATRR